MIQSLGKVKSLAKFKEALKYAWSKLQTEASRYWKDRGLGATKTLLNEDARLMISAYVLCQAAAKVKDFIPSFYALQPFVND